MKLAHNAHVALVDGESFSLFINRGQIFDPKLELVETPDLKATNFSAGVRHQDHLGKMLGRTQLDELAHGAAAAEWLNQKAITNEIEQVLVIADPKTLGEMRQHYHAELRSKLAGEIDKTLTGQPINKVEAAIDAA